MATPGPKPKPTALKELGGNPGKRKLNQREPKPHSRVTKPWGLAQNKLAGKFWDDHAEELERLGVLTGADVAAFRLMAEHYSLAIQAAITIRHEGLTTEDERGLTRKHPLLQVLRDQSTAFRQYAAEFGLTPSSRARLRLPEDTEQSSLADQLFKAITQEADSGD